MVAAAAQEQLAAQEQRQAALVVTVVTVFRSVALNKPFLRAPQLAAAAVLVETRSLAALELAQ